jgi:hypothetical protein
MTLGEPAQLAGLPNTRALLYAGRAQYALVQIVHEHPRRTVEAHRIHRS